MKKKLLYFFSVSLGLLALSNSSFGQTAATATWALSTDKTVATTGTITPSDQVLGGMTDRTYSSAIGFFGGGWQRLTSTSVYEATSTATPPVTSPSIPFVTGGVPDYTHYAEYKVTSNTGVFTRINSFKISALGGGTGNCRLVVLYSLDGFATTGLPMTLPGTYNDASVTATEASPVVLLNTSTAGNGTTTPATKTIDQATLVFTGINTILAPGETYTIRIYPFLSSASTTSARYFPSQNAIIDATTASAAALLPLDFTSFTAKPDAFGKTVSLAWATANEVNTKNFEIQKRTDATEFVTIGTLVSKNTAGNYNYSFTDNNATAGNSYYRILQFDNDDASTSSPIVPVTIKAGVELSVYPNPASDVLNVNHAVASNSATLKVLTINGKVVAQKSAIADSTSSSVDVSALAPGAYMLVFDNDANSASIKFIKK